MYHFQKGNHAKSFTPSEDAFYCKNTAVAIIEGKLIAQIYEPTRAKIR